MSKIIELKNRSKSFIEIARRCPSLFQDDHLDYCSATDDGTGDYKLCEVNNCPFLYWLRLLHEKEISVGTLYES